MGLYLEAVGLSNFLYDKMLTPLSGLDACAASLRPRKLLDQSGPFGSSVSCDQDDLWSQKSAYVAPLVPSRKMEPWDEFCEGRQIDVDMTKHVILGRCASNLMRHGNGGTAWYETIAWVLSTVLTSDGALYMYWRR